ncbi:hypothetical protein SO802_033905 [Lithocarpus litseifolius]|uniref:Transposase MuDR plant domain-containing protein n=1 Tax=Lithocarpus litseifolius TaxID=425828 RepID=A0AAW2BED9_9ROSI
MMIRRKLKTLNELKVKIMEELQVNPGFELYVTLEPRAEIVQTTTSLQFALLDDRCTTLGGYTPPFQETPTTIESEPSNRYEDQFCTHRGESSTFSVVEDEDEDYVDHATINGENLDDRDEYEERIEQDDFDRGVDDHEITPNPHVHDMAECDVDDVDATIRVQHVTNTTPVYEPPTSSFYANTWENMVDSKVVQQAFASSWKEDMNFSTGLIFANKEAVKRELTIYTAKHNRNVITSRSTKTRLSVKCMDESCKWYVGAVAKPKLGLWMVTSYGGPHSCMPLSTALDGRMMDCNFLAAEFVSILQKNHMATIDHLKDFIKAKYYGHELSYYKIWDAKQKVVAKIFGNWEESYQRLRKLLLAYFDQESGTRYWYHTEPRAEFGDSILRYVFWAFAPCIEGFRNCKPVISIDGTHLYCLRHVASNFNTHFQDATLKSLALKAGYATQEAKFELYMQAIKEAEIEALRKKLRTERQESEPDSSIMPYTYLIKEDLDMWTQLHDGGYRYGTMTTNV